MSLPTAPNNSVISYMDGPQIVDIAVLYADDLITVTVAGELDVSNTAWLHDTLHDAIDIGAAEIILDIAALTFMDTTGLTVLKSAHTRMQSTGGTLVILHPTPSVAKLLQIADLVSLPAIRLLRTNVEAPGGAS